MFLHWFVKKTKYVSFKFVSSQYLQSYKILRSNRYNVLLKQAIKDFPNVLFAQHVNPIDANTCSSIYTNTHTNTHTNQIDLVGTSCLT